MLSDDVCAGHHWAQFPDDSSNTCWDLLFIALINISISQHSIPTTYISIGLRWAPRQHFWSQNSLSSKQRDIKENVRTQTPRRSNYFALDTTQTAQNVAPTDFHTEYSIKYWSALRLPKSQAIHSLATFSPTCVESITTGKKKLSTASRYPWDTLTRPKCLNTSHYENYKNGSFLIKN